MKDRQQDNYNNANVKQGIGHSNQCIDRFKSDHHQSSRKDDQDDHCQQELINKSILFPLFPPFKPGINSGYQSQNGNQEMIF